MRYLSGLSRELLGQVTFGATEAVPEPHYEVQVPIFNAILLVYVGGDYVGVAKRYDASDLKVFEAMTIPNAPKHHSFMLFLNYPDAYPTQIDFCAVVSHEVTHLANRVLTNVKHTLKPRNDEVQAYLVQWLTTAILYIAHVHLDKRKPVPKATSTKPRK